MERILGALRTVKASGAEHREERTLHEAAEESWRQSVRAAKWSAAAGNTAGLAMQIAFITVLAVGGARVATGAIQVGTEGDQWRLGVAVAASLAEVHVGGQRVAEALASDGVMRGAALTQIDLDRFAWASVADTTVAGFVGHPQISQIA